jgi:hypothetical protein
VQVCLQRSGTLGSAAGAAGGLLLLLLLLLQGVLLATLDWCITHGAGRAGVLVLACRPR